MAIKTARTSLYFLDPVGPAVVAVGCVTTMSLGGASRDQVETTCLEEDARTYEAGLATPGQKTFTIQFDPSDSSHVRVYQLWKQGINVRWALGLSDGPPAPAALVPPTIDTTGEDFDLPDTRTFIVYDGFVQNVPVDLALNAMVAANVTVQVSGFPELYPRTAS